MNKSHALQSSRYTLGVHTHLTQASSWGIEGHLLSGCGGEAASSHYMCLELPYIHVLAVSVVRMIHSPMGSCPYIYNVVI